MVSGRTGCSKIGWSVECMGCPVDCIGCSRCDVHQDYQDRLCCLQQYSGSMLRCIIAADAARIIGKSLKAQVVLQVTIFVQQDPKSSLEWLAYLNKVRMRRMLALHCCSVSTTPTVFVFGQIVNAVLKG